MNLTIGTADPVNKILWDEYKADRASGGATLAATLKTASTYLLKGAPLYVNYSTRVAQLVKTAKIVAGGSATASRVEKNHEYKVGDAISETVGAIAVAITAIDTTNAAYDVLSHLSTSSAFGTGSIIFQAAEASATSAYLYTANALLSDNTKNVGSPTVTPIIGALEIQEANLPFYLTTAIKTALGARFQFV